MAAAAAGHRLRRLRNFLPHFPLGPKVQPEGRRGRGVRSAPPGKAAGFSAPTRCRCRSRAAGSPAGDYMATTRSPQPAAKLAAARVHGLIGAPARGDMPARVRALLSTVLPRCAPAAGTAASPAKPAYGTKRGRRRRRAAGEANGRAGAPVGGGCGAPGRTGVR